MTQTLDIDAKFWARVEYTDGCWLWHGPKTWTGYGQLKVNQRTKRAHRMAYELLVGPIPEGKELDHLCRVRNCVNPTHLEPVTHRENILRGENFIARNATATHCPHGHAYTKENTYLEDGRRRCRTCRRDQAKTKKEAAA